TFRGTYEEYLSVIHPEDREHVHLSLTELLTGSRSDLEIEHRSLLPDGSVRWLEGRGRVYRDETGHLIV
ncbi:MAG TPA: PAS domain-containing protein, partial [Chthonomonadaceae bacterium]|nr:PAS domain-containing protein [Chthonomonadaceae bacterium]